MTQAGRAAPEESRGLPGMPTAAHAYGLLGGIILLWGANWPIMKVGLEYLPPLWFGEFRLLIGAVALFAISAATGRLRLPARQDLPVLISVAVLQMVFFMALVNVALQFLPAGRSAVLAYTTPLWVVPAAVLVLGERLTPRKILGIVCGLAGLIVLFNPAAFDWTDPRILLGNAILLVTALAGATAIVHIRAHKWAGTPFQLAPWQLLLAATLIAVLAATFEDVSDIRWSATTVAILGYNGLLATAFCFWASVVVVRTLPAITSSLGFLGVPLMGVFLSTVALGEALTATLLGGLVLIISGLALVTWPGGPAGERRPGLSR